ncbi:hypothetical protein [Xanthomonas phage Tenjo]|nr:hypothetical protein [Xanthomonas phage Tenjo]
MRLLRATGWVMGGLVLGTGSLVAGAWLGPSGGGPGIALLGIIGALWMTERGMGVW